MAGLTPGADKDLHGRFPSTPHCPPAQAQAPQAFFSSTDSGNKLTPLNCGKWELSEKLIDTGGGGGGDGQRRKGKAETTRLSHWRGPAPLALIGAA